MSEWKRGDVVCLKSGGPVMVVLATDDGKALCVWLREGEVDSGIFSYATLVRAGAEA